MPKFNGKEQRCRYGHNYCDGGKSCTKKPSGRPTKWQPEFNRAIIDYFEPNRILKSYEDKSGRWRVAATRFPTLEGFANSIGVHVDTLNAWAKDESECPGFFGALSTVKQMQKDTLIQGALLNVFNSRFAIFFAKNNLGMSEDVNHDITVWEPPVIVNPGGDMAI